MGLILKKMGVEIGRKLAEAHVLRCVLSPTPPSTTSSPVPCHILSEPARNTDCRRSTEAKRTGERDGYTRTRGSQALRFDAFSLFSCTAIATPVANVNQTSKVLEVCALMCLSNIVCQPRTGPLRRALAYMRICAWVSRLTVGRQLVRCRLTRGWPLAVIGHGHEPRATSIGHRES